MIEKLKKDLKKLQNPKKAKIFQNFFKTGKGDYGEGQIFLGIDTNSKRLIAKKYLELGFKDIGDLLKSNIHDEKFIGMTILEINYRKKQKPQKKIVNFYLKNAKLFNNWDLVDLSAYKILGDWLINKEKAILYNLLKSGNLWEKRIAIISTYAFIRQNDFQDTINISKILLNDSQDLIHKSVGWMLREVGKRDKKVLKDFLQKNYKKMPRTMLRYSIEKFPEKERQDYLRGII